MMANVKTLNKKYWFKFLRFLQMILEAKYPQLQPTVSIYDTKIMNHMVFPMSNQKPRADVQVTYQNKKPLVKFGAFSEVIKEVQEPVNATVANELDIVIIDAPHGSSEPVENVDMTGIESEEDVIEESIMDDEEVNENVEDVETEVNVESLTTEVQNAEEPTSVNPPHTELVVIVSTELRTLLKIPRLIFLLGNVAEEILGLAVRLTLKQDQVKNRLCQ
ncbi:hypothetical protein HanRHA438_Chr06g0286051 [Helianthus annuus]|uniref:Uncharacterized protein n=1 Tax=Helianthus annuus TaxID=4232 RepID=A0A9K3IVE7_HELAN|nr:hypothetical protein HanXRQr2_Chr06g0276901 [Helianthus annuus]KAJ0561803.1 hypothetical protein HanHA300_Chr06g0227161 [Helianthus annuus]KAJ0568581.1 hypothetical protein HanIR_Chr06g0297811 [Helianthus annuus]KAJ0574868.1 hypothetical protein HanHA89_Chr06g0243131 [Helianthus annuus]KAJ0739198.1 hypothetical protein HanLR1_Chr06g0227181 [Helianthus annuus]